MVWKLIQHFEGQRTGSLIYHVQDGFYYHLNNCREGSRFAYLKCVRGGQGVRACEGTAKALKNYPIMKHMRSHNHGPDLLYPSEVELRWKIKDKVRSGDASSFGEIIFAAGEGFDESVRDRLPPSVLNSSLNKIRSANRPPVPDNLGVLGAALLQDEYKMLTRSHVIDENVYAGVCGTLADGTLSVVFISPEMRKFMGSRKKLFADGTWRKICKKPSFRQLFTICGIWRHHCIPMLRALMQRKTQDAYETLIDFVKILVPDLDPKEIMCDHERAELNAFQIKFLDAVVRGCLWHFAVDVWRHAIELGLHDLIVTEDTVSSIVRSACALPMLPTNHIEGGLEDLGWEAVETGWMPELKLFFQYLQKEWISRLDTLSVFKATDRTNNISESANRSYNKLVKVGRPSVFNVLESIIKLHDQALLDIKSLNRGLAVSRKRKVSALQNDLLIKRFTQDFLNQDITRLQFLHRASRRMQGVFQTVFNLNT